MECSRTKMTVPSNLPPPLQMLFLSLSLYSPNKHTVEPSLEGVGSSAGTAHSGRGVCGVRAGHEPQVSWKGQSGEERLLVKLTHVYLDLYFLYNKAAASVSNAARQTKAPLPPCLGCSQVWSFSTDYENEGFRARLSPTKASTRGALR